MKKIKPLQFKLKTVRPRYVVCLDNTGYDIALDRRKIYQTIPDRDAEARHQIRVVDESGEDYLFPARMFMPIALTNSIQRALSKAA
jgi:hypothetical protein